MNLATLLELVTEQRERRCAVMLASARADAGALLRQAQHDARRRVRDQLAAACELARQQLHAASARYATLQRQQQQQRQLALLSAGWPLLQSELVKRWQSPALRKIWLAGLYAQALSVLPNGAWTINHPLDWPQPEIAPLAEKLAAAPRLQADAAIRAGLRIAVGGTVLDGTLDGLLSDRAAVAARLLAAWEEAP